MVVIKKDIKINGVVKIITNLVWSSSDKIIRMGMGLIVGAWMARYLGPEKYGLLNYSFAFIFMVAPIASLGLDDIVIRELTKKHYNKDTIIGTAFYLKLLSGILSVVIAYTSAIFIKSNNKMLIYMILIISLTFIFQSFDVIDFWFQSKVEIKYVVIARNLSFFIISGLKIIFIFLKMNILYFALIATLESFFNMINLICIYRKIKKENISEWKFNYDIAIKMLKDSCPLIFSSVFISLYMRMDQLMVGQMLGNAELGIYSAAVKVAELWYFVPISVAGILYPYIISAKERGEDLYYRRIQVFYDFMSLITWIIVLPLCIFSKLIIKVLYGENFIGASTVLSIYVLSGISTSLGIASGKYLMTENLTNVSFIRTLVGCIVNIILNIILIPKYKIVGAAWASFIAYFVATFITILFSKTHKQTGVFIKSVIPINIKKDMKYIMKYIEGGVYAEKNT